MIFSIESLANCHLARSADANGFADSTAVDFVVLQEVSEIVIETAAIRKILVFI